MIKNQIFVEKVQFQENYHKIPTPDTTIMYLGHIVLI